MENYFICDVCKRKTEIRESRISFIRQKYFIKREKTNEYVRQYELCKDCYKKFNTFFRKMIIEGLKTGKQGE